jgi:hypothetical protein
MGDFPDERSPLVTGCLDRKQPAGGIHVSHFLNPDLVRALRDRGFTGELIDLQHPGQVNT